MSALPSGTTNAQAKLIQRALNEKTGLNLTVDGNFGPMSVNALKAYQQLNHLPQTGIYDAATQGLLAPFIAQKYLTLADYQQAAQALSLDVAAVQAVCTVETSGAGFFNNGQCTILYERHQMFRTLGTVMSPAQVQQLSAQYPNLVNATPGGYIGGAAEWGRLTQMESILTGMGLDEGLAMRCCSWGLFQIMGYYYIQCGYPSVKEFVAALQVSEHNQLLAFVEYLKDMNGGSMLTALRNHDWTGFANQYNGRNQHAQNNYDGKMAAAYQALAGHA
jgi:hypothetical protein